MDEIKEKVKLHHWVQRAYDRLREKYGERADEIILTRFYNEERYFFRNQERVKNLDLLVALKQRAAEQGERIYSFGVEMASLIAYLFGAIDENPLPLHYYCPKCKKVEYIDEKLLPWDVSPKPCDCGGEMRADGFDIPFESYKYVIGSPHVCTSKKFENEAKNIADGSFKIYPIDNLDILRILKEQTVTPTDEQVFASFNSEDIVGVLYLSYGIPASFTRDFMKKTDPKNYYDLIKIFGFANGKGAWYDNAEKFIGDGVCKLSDISVHHEDVLIQVQNAMSENGIEEKRLPHHIAFNAHYGRYATEGMSEEDETKLRELGFDAGVIRRVAIAMYEGEINMVIHAEGGEAIVSVYPEKIEIVLADRGPGIADIELAMQEGYSTAPDNVRALGFGAGMGLPNMKRYSDEFEIKSVIGEGTTVKMTVYTDTNL